MRTELEQIPTFAGLASWNAKSGNRYAIELNGESDGTRTRDLRRDRPPIFPQNQCRSNFEGVENGHKSNESWNAALQPAEAGI